MGRMKELAVEMGLLDDPVSQTLQERGVRYGEYRDVSWTAQMLKNILRQSATWDYTSPVQRESLEMICNKLSRIVNGDPNYIDSWHDIQGYAKLVEDELTKVTKNETNS